jgi:AraC family transcriptional regulator
MRSNSTMKVEMKKLPALRLAAVRHIGPYEQIHHAFARLGQIAGRAGLFGRPEMVMAAIYHDLPGSTPPARLRSDAGLTIAEGVPVPDGLTEQRIAGGEYATTLHLGSYDTLPDTWRRLIGEWLPASGRKLGAGSSYEVYLNDPTTTPKNELQTELRVPVS